MLLVIHLVLKPYFVGRLFVFLVFFKNNLYYITFIMLLMINTNYNTANIAEEFNTIVQLANFVA